MNLKFFLHHALCRPLAPTLALALFMTGCANIGNQTSANPVLYPNAAYNAMGEATAKQHLAQCQHLAQTSGLSPTDKKNSIESQAAMGAAVAGVTGAVGGLVFGRGNLNDAVKYGVQSAVVGAAAGGTRGAFTPQTNATYRQFVQRCASEKGLDIIGWQ